MLNKWLVYKNHGAGLNNNLMSLELALGIAYLCDRQLAFYGDGENSSLLPIATGGSSLSLEHQALIDNSAKPTILDLLQPLPVRINTYQDYLNTTNPTQGRHLKVSNLLNYCFFKSENLNEAYNTDDFSQFVDGRKILTDTVCETLHITDFTLGFYSRFFYKPSKDLYSLFDFITFRHEYLYLASMVTRTLGAFNGLHLRLGDFNSFLPQNIAEYQQEILTTLLANFDTKTVLVIQTNGNKNFFDAVVKKFKKVIFLEEFILNEFKGYFKLLPFKSEVILSLLGYLVMPYARDFIGTPGSTFSAVIHRNWLKLKLQQGYSITACPFKFVNKGLSKNTEFKDGQFLVTNPQGAYSWNRSNLSLHTEMKSWYREWEECVIH